MRSKRSISRVAPAAGFTLIEIALAVLLTGMILALAGGTFFGLRRGLSRLDEVMSEEVGREQALILMEREFRCATLGMPNPSPSDLLPEDRGLSASSYLFTVRREQTLGKSTGRVQWVALSQYTLPGTAPLPAAMELDLRTEVDQDHPGLLRIVRRADSYPDGTFEEDTAGETLLGGLDEVTWECWDGAQWLREWDSASRMAETSTSARVNALPAAVRLGLRMPARTKEKEGELLQYTWFLAGGVKR